MGKLAGPMLIGYSRAETRGVTSIDWIAREGAEFRRRGREKLWKGRLTLTGNTWHGPRPLNRFTRYRRLDPAPHGLASTE
jgi:hypothetical protein